MSANSGHGLGPAALLAIDPGSKQSAYAVIDSQTCRPVRIGKVDNRQLLGLITTGGFDDCDGAAVEMIASYGMAVGREVFDTCVWIGRYIEAMHLIPAAPPQPLLVYRKDVKLHHCGTLKAKDQNVIRALVDRFAPGQSNYGKGTKAAPGWFYGFSADVWQAYAVAVLLADRLAKREGVA